MDYACDDLSKLVSRRNSNGEVINNQEDKMTTISTKFQPYNWFEIAAIIVLILLFIIIRYDL